MGPRGVTSLLIFYTNRYWKYIVLASIVVIVIFIKNADHQASREVSEVSVQMQPYLTMYPSVIAVKDNNAFIKALGAKDRDTKLHYNWSFTTEDSVEQIRNYYLSDLGVRGYTLKKNTANILYAKKGALGVKVTFTRNDDDTSNIGVIIHN